MIVKMSKYEFILHAVECKGFVDRLRELGMVDITTLGWEPSESDRELIMEVESHAKAEHFVEEFKQSEGYDASAKSCATGDKAYEKYCELSGRMSEYNSQIAQLEKLSDEVLAWGEFSQESLQQLSEGGLELRYFVCGQTDFDKIVAERGEELVIAPINEVDGRVYFVVVLDGRNGEKLEVDIDAEMVKPLTISASEARIEIAQLESQKLALNGDLSQVANSVDLIVEHGVKLREQLQLSRISSSSQHEAEGSLLVMEAWAEAETASQVDELLESQAGLIYFKSEPTPEDNTPVKLKNDRFSRLFEMVTKLYALPKYGTLDLTPFFAPFYMLFFAICLCDAGYGAIILAAGIGLFFKGGESMRTVSKLSMFCGGTAVLFGVWANSLFGMELSGIPIFEGFRFINFQTEFFTISLVIGMLQIIYALIINIVITTHRFGVKYALGTIGWFMMLIAVIASALLTNMGVTGFGFDSIPFYALLVAGAVLLIFFNTPGQNIFANIGPGLWDTYNNITGLLGDVLSYVRLFAIGLSGGVLALVFNDLAIGITGLDAAWGDQSIVALIFKVLGASIILLFGHGINLFMSTISSMVHPMRLTFVEFYKNAGFEMSTREFKPITKSDKE
ncbi:MAG: V-type ATP synthase subunit I [Rikenellaceae bacterium]